MGMFSRRSAGYLVVATTLALTLIGPSLAQSQGQEVTIRDEKQLVESLRSGGYVIVVRHGATSLIKPIPTPSISITSPSSETSTRRARIWPKHLATQSARLASLPAKSTRATSIVRLRRRHSPDLKTSKRQKHFSHHAQAQHHRCVGQGLVRCEGRRSIDFQARGWQVSTCGPRANGGLAEVRCRQIEVHKGARPDDPGDSCWA